MNIDDKVRAALRVEPTEDIARAGEWEVFQRRARRSTVARATAVTSTVVLIASLGFALSRISRDPEPSFANPHPGWIGADHPYQEPRVKAGIDAARKPYPNARVLVALLTTDTLALDLIGSGSMSEPRAHPVVLVGLEGEFGSHRCPRRRPQACQWGPRVWRIVDPKTGDGLSMGDIGEDGLALVDELREMSLFLDARVADAGAEAWLGEHVGGADTGWLYAHEHGPGVDDPRHDYRTWLVEKRRSLRSAQEGDAMYVVELGATNGEAIVETLAWGPGRDREGNRRQFLVLGGGGTDHVRPHCGPEGEPGCPRGSPSPAPMKPDWHPSSGEPPPTPAAEPGAESTSG